MLNLLNELSPKGDWNDAHVGALDALLVRDITFKQVSPFQVTGDTWDARAPAGACDNGRRTWHPLRATLPPAVHPPALPGTPTIDESYQRLVDSVPAASRRRPTCCRTDWV